MSPERSFANRWRVVVCIIMLLVVAAAGCTSRGTPGEPVSPSSTAQGGGTAREQEIVSFISVTVAEASQQRLSRVNVIPRHAIVPAGEAAVFSFLAYDAQGNSLPPAQLTARWRSLDFQAGSITRSGVFHAGFQRGVFTQAVEVSVIQEVEGRLVELQGLASVSVIRPLSELDISRVQVIPNELQVESGARLSLVALALDRNGIPVPEARFSWEMLDPRAGSISANGRFVSGAETGSFPAAIRVVAHHRDDPTQTATATVPVTVLEEGGVEFPSKVNLYPQAVILRSGDTIEFRALAIDRKGNLLRDADTSWVLKDPRVGRLDGRGRFRAGSAPGTYPNLVEVTVTPIGAGAPLPLKATATVTILEPVTNPRRLERLFLTPQVVRLRAGESVRMVARAVTRGGAALPSSSLRWQGRGDVVEVRPNGTVIALDRPGVYSDAVTVTVSQEEAGASVTLTASASVIILGPLSRVELVPRTVVLSPGQAVQVTALAYDVNGARLFDAGASWTVLDKRAGTVDANGLFVAGRTPGEYKDVLRVAVKRLDRGRGRT